MNISINKLDDGRFRVVVSGTDTVLVDVILNGYSELSELINTVSEEAIRLSEVQA